VSLAWLLFKLPNVEHVGAFLVALFRGTQQPADIPVADWIVLYSLPVVLYYVAHLLKAGDASAALQRCEFLLLGTMLAGVVLNSGSATPFIYFQF
jgi:alginate O-acetyltransferase complex protein AlgI